MISAQDAIEMNGGQPQEFMIFLWCDDSRVPPEIVFGV
jgi:hypothetical protein